MEVNFEGLEDRYLRNDLQRQPQGRFWNFWMFIRGALRHPIPFPGSNRPSETPGGPSEKKCLFFTIFPSGGSRILKALKSGW